MDKQQDIKPYKETILHFLQKPVFLIGMMGSGKSRLGARLADILGVPFYDADGLIETRAGARITEIFQRDGEAKFREAERAVITDLTSKPRCVVATGGGAVAGEGMMDLMVQKTLTVWLDTDMDEILRRVSRNNKRPLLQQGNPADILAELKTRRAPHYERAAVKFTNTGGEIDDNARALLRLLSTHLKGDNVAP